MDDFDNIRPYQDHELQQVFRRLTGARAFVALASSYVAPRLNRTLPPLARLLVRFGLRRTTRRFKTVKDVQVALSRYVETLIARTTEGFNVSGLEHLKTDEPYLFISSHRDIVCDPAAVNYILWAHGHETSQIAIGDNLLNEGFETDLMRINKSFVVKRGGDNLREHYDALLLTSRYVRHALEAGESVWIAHREGRTKDGIDRTHEGIFRMFRLAYGKHTSVAEWLRHVRLVPVSISYEIDPCAAMKARELYLRDANDTYEKQPGEDMESMSLGIGGFKGRMHVAFSPPVHGEFAGDEDLAAYVDQQIVGGLVTYPSQWLAEGLLRGETAPVLMSERVRAAFDEALESCPAEHVPFLLRQYANQIQSKRDLGLAPDPQGAANLQAAPGPAIAPEPSTAADAGTTEPNPQA